MNISKYSHHQPSFWPSFEVSNDINSTASPPVTSTGSTTLIYTASSITVRASMGPRALAAHPWASPIRPSKAHTSYIFYYASRYRRLELGLELGGQYRAHRAVPGSAAASDAYSPSGRRVTGPSVSRLSEINELSDTTAARGACISRRTTTDLLDRR